MALSFKIEVKIDIDGTVLYITDKTGQYDAVDNEGGWGTPNETRNLNALMAIVEKIVHEEGKPNTFATPLSNQVVYNDAVDNTYETPFQFQMGKDGGYIHYLLLIPATDDGITSFEGNTIADGEYYYLTTDSTVYQKATTGDTVVDDYSVLVDPTNNNAPFQANCQKMWTPQLSMKEGELYKEYIAARENCDNEKEILLEGLELGFNIKHANGTFYQALQLEAEDIIETQREKYGL